MNSKVYTIFCPKFDKQKVKVTPKLNITAKIKSNVNYIDVLSQIQSRKKELNEVNLFKNFFSQKKKKFTI